MEPVDLALAHRLLSEAVDVLEAVVDSGGAGDDELLSALTLCEGMARRLDRVAVSSVAALSRRGTFSERGYRSPVAALGDLLGWERFEARRRVVAAEQVCARVGLDGSALPPRLPATAAVFAAGETGLRHVDVVAEVLGSAAAGRLTPAVWAGAEVDLAVKAGAYTPSELRSYGVALIEALDADGAEPDDRPPPPVNEMHLTRNRSGGGGTFKGRFDDAAMFDAFATLVDAHAAPLSAEDRRPAPQRQGEALADICGFVLDHGDVPERGGRRPHLNVLINLEDLEGRCRSAILDLGGSLSPASLRLLACDAAVVPIVLGGAGQPLDVGRATRTIPDGIRRRSLPGTVDVRIPVAVGPFHGPRSTTSPNGFAITARRRSRTASHCVALIIDSSTTNPGGTSEWSAGYPNSHPRHGSARTGHPGADHCPTSSPAHRRCAGVEARARTP